MQSQTNKPFYYFLHKFYGKQKQACPICEQDWKLQVPLHKLYSYKCDTCLLLSDEGSR
ncbi:DUF2310 family Zn-ribbon-containing protein [Desulfosporosinus sp. SB140]|uniref:DUF2310 family Zn-ribbon-containing protein n=1 Tax=Desulfosporosinus paludis TaxID=3115649 RepID=UPI00388F67A4